MYKCEVCKGSTKPHEKIIKLIVARVEVRHTRMKADGEVVVEGVGTQIKREIQICGKCASAAAEL